MQVLYKFQPKLGKNTAIISKTIHNNRNHIQYRLRRTLHLFERTHTHYEHTEYASVFVRAPMETIGARIPNRRA